MTYDQINFLLKVMEKIKTTKGAAVGLKLTNPSKNFGDIVIISVEVGDDRSCSSNAVRHYDFAVDGRGMSMSQRDYEVYTACIDHLTAVLNDTADEYLEGLE